MEGMGRVRVRQHVNPLRAEYQQPIGQIDWAQAFEDPSLPLVVDLGCGPGRFLLLLHRRAAAGAPLGGGVPPGGGCNFLGIEIRKPLVDRANEWAKQLGCAGRVHYVFANATVSLAGMLQGYPGTVEAFYVQFPDPHFKKKHRKRRLLQPETVLAMRDALRPGGLVFLQSDILQAAEGMRDALEEVASDAFELAPQHNADAVAADGSPAVFFAESSATPASVGGSAQATTPATATDPATGGASAAAAAAADPEGGDHQLCAAAAAGTNDERAAAGASGEKGEEGSVDEEGDEEAPFVSRWAEGGWLRDNPVGVPTEREHYVVDVQGGAVYRALLVRK